ncbi:MAG: PDZ domain-containing protein [Bacteroidales bacterium]
MIKKTRSILLLFFLFAGAGAQEEARLLRFPAIHGDQIVFSHAGNLYTVNSSGGTARKLTSHDGYEMFPRFSPDGSLIAFTGQYDGNTEVFVIPAAGGEPKRLTYTATLDRDDPGDRMGPNNIVMGWTPDGNHITFRSRKRSFNSFKGHLYNVPADGGLPVQIPLSEGGFLSYSLDGKKMAYNRVFREFRTWKYYEGGMADDVWVYDMVSRTNTNITDSRSQDIIPMWVREEIYFLSDRERTMNLYVYNTKTRQTSKVTNFTEYDIKFPSLGKDNIVFENGGYIYKFNVRTKEYEKVPVMISGDFIHARAEWKDVSESVRSADMSPNGERLVFAARGEVFNVPVKSGITRNLTRTPGVHDRNASWSPDGKNIAWVSDKSGEFEIYMQQQDGSQPPVQLTTAGDTYIFNFRWSPDSRKILYHDKKNRLRIVDVATREITDVAYSGLSVMSDYSWSRDSRWITYTRPEQGMNVVCLYNVSTGSSHDVTEGWYASGSATFSPDGKYLVFSSRRDFNPTYSQTEWNHAYTDMTRIYLAALSKDTPSPFAPEDDKVETAGDQAEESSASGNRAGAGDIIKVDTDGIQDRIISLPVKASNYYNVVAAEDRVYYNERSAGAGSATMKMYDLKNRKETELGENLSFSISSNNKKMLVRSRNNYAVIDLPSSKIDISDHVDLSNMRSWVDYSKEWQQIFDESWRQMRDFFYDPNMHGVDWKAMYEKYNVLIPHVRHRTDLTYIIGELIAELNVGHAYAVNGERPMPERISTGLLGAELSEDSSGYAKIERILEGANWSSDLRSPLTEMGLDINEGDYILAVNGNPVNEENNIYKLLVNTADNLVELTVNSEPETSGSRKVIVRPVADESDLYYYNWVQDNIRKVDEATGGQVGYIHIPDMGVNGLNQWARLYYPQLQKRGLIIDDRGNGGGNVSPMIIERLNRTMTYATMNTNRTEGSVNPVGTHVGPKVALIDRYSASDGDLFPYRFRKKDIGKIIGVTSWGGVVGYSGAIPAMDGGSIITPSYAPYAADGSGFIIEGEGVEPDIWIDNDPAREFRGIDDQLNKAIEVILESIGEWDQWVPPIPDFPDKSK